jgi:2-desacetyl-2-hydroxyethyl bacteriochlorophyllide A dehydrogenase
MTTGTMKAAVLRGWNDLAVEDVPRPVPGPREVLLQVKACGLCGTDLKMVKGGFEGRWPPSLPFVIGHEWSGQVVEIGADLENLPYAVGDRVVAENHAGCGACPTCRAGSYNLCEGVKRPGYKLYGHTAPGALAEYALRPPVVLHRIPPEISDVEAALINQGAMTVHALRRVQFRAGSTVAIFGPGLLGMLTAAVARAAGATSVIVVGRGHRLTIAEKMGATAVVDYEQTDPVAGVRDHTDGVGVDYAFDCSGNVEVLGQALDTVRRGGKVAVLGLAGGQTATVSPDRLVLDEIDLLGIRSSPNAYAPMIELMASGAVDVSPLITHVYELDDVEKAFDALRSREAIRPIIKL